LNGVKRSPVRGRFVQASEAPYSLELRRGAELYRQVYRFEPARLQRHAYPRLAPPVVVTLGELVGVIYRSDKWNPGLPQTYIHFMEDRPQLASNVEGSQLYIVGGSYRITARGIEG
jgi:hypothetical protein